MEMKNVDGTIKVKNGEGTWTVSVIYDGEFYSSQLALSRKLEVGAPDISEGTRNKGPFAGLVRLATEAEVRRQIEKTEGVKRIVMLHGKFRIEGRHNPVVHEGRVYATRRELGAATGMSDNVIEKEIAKGNGLVCLATEAQIRDRWPNAVWEKSPREGIPQQKQVVGEIREKDGKFFIANRRGSPLVLVVDGRVCTSEEVARAMGYKFRSSVSKAMGRGNSRIRPATKAEAEAFVGGTAETHQQPETPHREPQNIEPATKFLGHVWPRGAVTIISPDAEFSMTRAMMTDIPREILVHVTWVGGGDGQ